MSDKLLDALIAAKVPSDLVAAVAMLIGKVAALEAARQNQDARDQHQREVNAARQAKWRSKRRYVTLQDVSHGDKTASILTSFLPSLEKEEKKVRKKDRGTRIADDWIASAEDVAFARQYLPDDNAIADEEAKFRDYWKARPGAGGRKSDWPATWRNWIRNNRKPHGHGNGGAPRPGSREDRQERSANAYRKLSEYVEANSDEAERGDSPRKETAPWLSLVKPT